MTAKVNLLMVFIAVGITQLVTAQDSENFAQNLLRCVENQRSKYDNATLMFSGEAITNESVDKCLKQSMEELRPTMRTGIPSLGLKPTDPLSIENLELQHQNPPLDIDTKLTDLTVTGLSRFVTRRVSADLKAKSLEIVITVPKLHITGNYATNSKLVFIHIEGDGPFTSNLTELTGLGKSSISVVDRTIGGKPAKTLMVENASFDFNIAKASMKLENLFPGKKALAAAADNFLNSMEFTKMVQNQVKPQVIGEVNTLFEEVMNTALSQFDVSNYLEQLGYSE